MAAMDDHVNPGPSCEARAAEEAAFAPAGFRDESSGRPLVYGYVRSTRQRSAHLDACRRRVTRYCDREQLRLCTVFIDTEIVNESAKRPGLTGLCDVLRLPDSFAAVVLGVHHLSRDPDVAELLVRQVRTTGARLLFTQPPSGHVGIAQAQGALSLEWWQ